MKKNQKIWLRKMLNLYFEKGMDNRRYKDINDITPVDEFYNVGPFKKMYFKRDDLFLPYDGLTRYLGGGKTRQTITLFEHLKDELKKYDGVITYSSVGSPQAVIVVKGAIDAGYKAAISFGVNDTIENVVKNHKPIRACKELGAELYNVAKIGYNNVLLAKTEEIAKKHNYYIIHFGINIDNAAHALTDTIANQVQNIPDKLDFLIIPVGSGIQTAAILYGIKKFKKEVGKVIGIQISGYDRSKTIGKLLTSLECEDVPYEQIIDKTYPYSTHIEYPIRHTDFRKNINLNVVYESKAMDYVVKHREELEIKRDSEILYWVVGENNYLYH